MTSGDMAKGAGMMQGGMMGIQGRGPDAMHQRMEAMEQKMQSQSPAR